MGFAEQLQEILARLPGSHQTVLFSATLPKLLVEFARAGEKHGVDGLGWAGLGLASRLGDPILVAIICWGDFSQSCSCAGHGTGETELGWGWSKWICPGWELELVSALCPTCHRVPQVSPSQC